MLFYPSYQLEKCLKKETTGVCAESVFEDVILKIS